MEQVERATTREELNMIQEDIEIAIRIDPETNVSFYMRLAIETDLNAEFKN